MPSGDENFGIYQQIAQPTGDAGDVTAQPPQPVMPQADYYGAMRDQIAQAMMARPQTRAPSVTPSGGNMPWYLNPEIQAAQKRQQSEDPYGISYLSGNRGAPSGSVSDVGWTGSIQPWQGGVTAGDMPGTPQPAGSPWMFGGAAVQPVMDYWTRGAGAQGGGNEAMRWQWLAQNSPDVYRMLGGAEAAQAGISGGYGPGEGPGSAGGGGGSGGGGVGSSSSSGPGVSGISAAQGSSSASASTPGYGYGPAGTPSADGVNSIGGSTAPGWGGFGAPGFGIGETGYTGQPGFGLGIGTMGTPGQGTSDGWGYGASEGDPSGSGAW